MMAKEARETALVYNTSESNAIYIKAMEAIKRAATNGAYYTTVDFTISGDVHNKLTSMGYTLKNESNQREGSSCFIKW